MRLYDGFAQAMTSRAREVLAVSPGSAEKGVTVEVADGNRGELSVAVDGRTVAQKQGDTLPTQDEVLAAVRSGQPASAR